MSGGIKVVGAVVGADDRGIGGIGCDDGVDEGLRNALVGGGPVAVAL